MKDQQKDEDVCATLQEFNEKIKAATTKEEIEKLEMEKFRWMISYKEILADESSYKTIFGDKSSNELLEIKKEYNKAWRANHDTIRMCIHNFLINNRRIPSITEIAGITQLSRVTVTHHMKELDYEKIFGEEMFQHKYLLSNVMNSLYIEAMNGNVNAARLYFEIITFPDKKNAAINKTNSVTYKNNIFFIIKSLVDKGDFEKYKEILYDLIKLESESNS